MNDKFPLGCLFSTASFLIAMFYFIGILEQQKDISDGMRNMMYALTGRNETGQFIETTIEEVEDTPPVYYPQIPKETEKEWQV